MFFFKHENSIELSLKDNFTEINISVSVHKTAGAPYTKWIASLELRHNEHNNDP